MKKLQFVFIFLLFGVVFILFSPFLIKGLLPIPSDTIVGLYHPFRDLYSNDFTRGIPFKNFLITDPVRQTYPWKNLAIEQLRQFSLPLWNPYEMAGKPLLASFQSSPFYPLNIILFVKPFFLSWSIFILIQPLLAGLFLYLYLANLNLDRKAAILGTLSFCLSGFFIAWLEWGTIVHVGLWLPLILLSIDKIFYHSQTSGNLKFKIQISKLQLKTQKYFPWAIVFLLSLMSSFFAGHLQIFFYLLIISIAYFLARWIQFGRKRNTLFLYIILNTLFIMLTSVQWIPTLQFILLSARNVDQSALVNPGWFIPWQHLVQFVAPDFFGNPTTLNYWGVWNYAEFVGYIGIFPLIMALFGLLFRHDRKTLFYGTILFLSLLFSLPTIFAKAPYILSIPFLSTAQPTRLLFLTCFSLTVLSALGFDHLLKQKKGIWYSVSFIAVVFILLWLFALFGKELRVISTENLQVAKRNLFLPSAIFITSTILIFLFSVFSKKRKHVLILCSIIVAVTAFDLLRFSLKFTPFTKKEYLFPETKVISFLKNQRGQFRIASTDSRIFPPNFSTYYRIQSIEGYDPLYLRSYAELIAASERGKPNISPPFGFNRIITPHNIDSKVIDLLNVKYVLSLSELRSTKFEKVLQERETRLYKNRDAFDRVFFVEAVVFAKIKEEQMKNMFAENLKKNAIVEGNEKNLKGLSVGEINIVSYQENQIIIRTKNKKDGFLVIGDVYYPTWKAFIDGRQQVILKTDYTFRGLFVPKGEHEIRFIASFF